MPRSNRRQGRCRTETGNSPTREADFLGLIKQTVYENPTSPYRRLLQFAGCEYGDLHRFVRKEGIEAALTRLLQEGVYLTVEEFKGVRLRTAWLIVTLHHLVELARQLRIGCVVGLKGQE